MFGAVLGIVGAIVRSASFTSLPGPPSRSPFGLGEVLARRLGALPGSFLGNRPARGFDTVGFRLTM